MENAGFHSHESIEMDSTNKKSAKCASVPMNKKESIIDLPCSEKYSETTDKKGNNQDARHHCNINKCCITDPNKIEGSWHSMKTIFLLFFLIGFLIWAVLYFFLLHYNII